LALKRYNIRPQLVTSRFWTGPLSNTVDITYRLRIRILYVLDEHRSDDGAMYFKKLLRKKERKKERSFIFSTQRSHTDIIGRLVSMVEQFLNIQYITI
jgi:hypothetical protein